MDHTPSLVADVVPQRAEALEAMLLEHGVIAPGDVDTFIEHGAEQWVTRNGATMIARAWLDADYKARLLADGRAAALELGFPMPPHHRHLVVLENQPDVHNVIVCTLCSCTAFTLIGVAPSWYKDLDYRARVVRQSRTVLREMGLDLPEHVDIRVWDTTADTRYMVMPQRPAGTDGFTEAQLAALVTKESLIGVAHLAAQR